MILVLDYFCSFPSNWLPISSQPMGRAKTFFKPKPPESLSFLHTARPHFSCLGETCPNVMNEALLHGRVLRQKKTPPYPGGCTVEGANRGGVGLREVSGLFEDSCPTIYNLSSFPCLYIDILDLRLDPSEGEIARSGGALPIQTPHTPPHP